MPEGKALTNYLLTVRIGRAWQYLQDISASGSLLKRMRIENSSDTCIESLDSLAQDEGNEEVPSLQRFARGAASWPWARHLAPWRLITL